MSNAPDQASRVEHVHQLFRRAAEFTKSLCLAALLIELLAATIAAVGSYVEHALWGGWASLVMVVLLITARGLRIWSRSTHDYSERCRRISARTWALGEDLGASTCSALVSDEPWLGERFGKSLPASNLSDYYEPTLDVGGARLQEIYAHSSFYSWRLLRRSGWLFLFSSAAVGAVGMSIVYWLALPSSAASAADRVLEVVCSLVFVVLTAKAVDASVASFLAARNSREISDGLIGTVDEHLVQDLMARYDMQRVSGPTISTLAYSYSRDGLQEEWHQRRQALDELWSTGDT